MQNTMPIATESTPTPDAASEARPADAVCWAAVCARDAAADGGFVYAVRTTGVFCRPSCPSRRPRRENVRFFATAAGAAAAGFRACRRCRPQGPGHAAAEAALVARACALIEAAESPPRLADLAAELGYSPWHFHRLFRRVTGVTPRAYAEARRRERMHTELGRDQRVTDALYAAGFNSNGRFYAATRGALGMTPRTFRAGGAGERIHFAVGACSLGAILVAASDQGVCAISLGDDPEALVHALEERFHQAELIGGDGDFEAVVARVIAFVEAPQDGLELPLDVRGTAFQERVWQALRAIPAGRTASYAEIAAAIGQPAAVRAVARACASNTLAVAIPCHRVVRTDGALSGYRWGVERKRALLAREARE
ncbi:MAG: bifunctional DNA-binding transcriptional regulator/O6-methylguanine-DNA methyltransferase Ada [Gammaproteobacteria bacterium]